LLSDFYPHGEIAQRYGVLRQEGFTERAIFVVDKEGIVRYRDIHAIDQQPDNEVLLQALRQLEPEAAKKLAATVPLGEPAATAARTEQPTTTQQAPATAQQPNVIMYCTPWCPDCRNARRYLDGRGLKYTEVDISKDKAAEKRARELAHGKLVTPTFDIEGKVVLDFDRKRLEEILGKP
jgi:glutaredoxin